MYFTVVYDAPRDWYEITLDMEIEGIPVTNKTVSTSEIIDSYGSKILEYEAEQMMMNAMKLMSEALMPQAMNQIAKGIEESKKNPGEAYPNKKFINGISVKYGKQVTSISNPDEMDWVDDDNGQSVRNLLGQYIDLKQRVSVTQSALEDAGVDEDYQETYRDVSLGDAIIFLNDDAKWSYEQIADWLETLDVDIALNLKGGE